MEVYWTGSILFSSFCCISQIVYRCTGLDQFWEELQPDFSISSCFLSVHCSHDYEHWTMLIEQWPWWQLWWWWHSFSANVAIMTITMVFDGYVNIVNYDNDDRCKKLWQQVSMMMIKHSGAGPQEGVWSCGDEGQRYCLSLGSSYPPARLPPRDGPPCILSLEVPTAC